MHVSNRRRDRVVSGGLLLLTALGLFGPRQAAAADITFTLTNFNVSTLNLSDVIRAVNFHETDSFDVTIGGQTAHFEATGPVAELTANHGFTAYTPTNALPPTYAMVQGNPELMQVITSHAWIDDAVAPVHQVPITGLAPGQTYEIQAFFHDGRTTGCGIGCGNRTVGYGDQDGISTELVTRGSGTIAVGIFTADSDTQMLAVGGGDWDAGLSGYVLRSAVPLVPGDTDGDGTGGEFPDDFAPIRANFRNAVSSRAMGDLVGNGLVDFADFRQWKEAHLAAGGSLAGLDLSLGANVPEPTSLALMLCGMIALASRKCRPPRSNVGRPPILQSALQVETCSMKFAAPREMTEE